MKTRHLGVALLAFFFALPVFGQADFPPSGARVAFRDQLLAIGANYEKQDNYEKKVPGTDKSSGELIGTVAGVTGASACGVQEAIIVLNVKGVYPVPAPEAAVCVGGILPQCVALHAGQRVRLLGQIYAIPDLTTPGVDPCDFSTWQFLLPVFGFRVTQVIK
jgi:hypothetical protein